MAESSKLSDRAEGGWVTLRKGLLGTEVYEGVKLTSQPFRSR